MTSTLAALIALWITAALAASVVHHRLKVRGLPSDAARQGRPPLRNVTIHRRPYDQDTAKELR